MQLLLKGRGPADLKNTEGSLALSSGKDEERNRCNIVRKEGMHGLLVPLPVDISDQ